MQYRNTNPRSFSFLPNPRVDWQSLPDRSIITNVPDREVPTNEIKTTNSNFLTFIPINIFTQLSKSANIYFIVVAILMSIKSISVTNGRPLVLIPFGMVMIGVLLKDGYEQYERYKKDKVANNQRADVLREGGFRETTWERLMIGDVIMVRKEEFAPCDFVVLQTSDEKGKGYVETKNLDGETNYKAKSIPQLSNFDIQKLTPQQLYRQRYLLRYQKPNPNLHHFNGSIQIHNEKAPLKIQNLILRGSSIQIVDWVIGVCVYTGKQTKILLNFVQFRTKRSNLDRLLGDIAILILFIQFTLSSTCAIINYLFQQSHIKERNQIPDKPFYLMIGSWWLTMSYFVPVSLIVTLETIKLVQALIMTKDSQMRAEMNNLMPQVNNSSVNQDLGQIRYVFSDKTGTLTCNIMNFKVLSTNGKIYGNLKSQQTSSSLPLQMQKLNITNVNFDDKEFMSVCGEERFHDFFRTLFLCHDVMVQFISQFEEKYSSSSPDEISFINFSKLCGYEYLGQEKKELMIKNRHSGAVEKYKVLALLEFTSDRKRMSVIVQGADGEIIMYTKGADNVVSPLVKPNDPNLKQTMKHIDQFSNNGFRTLILAKKTLTKEHFNTWFKEYSQALTEIQEREAKVEIVCKKIENELEIIGATGIEDKLQNRVKETIEQLKSAGMVVYILTGDKRETAVNVGRSCGLIGPKTKILTIPEGLSHEQFESWKQQHSPFSPNSVLLLNASLPLTHLTIPLHPTICYRCTPSQKQNIVDSVKSQSQELTLAIGDGSNDVNMITRADVGISIRGVEGNDATRVSDFVIGQFSLLAPLTLYYGREWYRKNSKLVNYVMIKNIYHVAAVIGFGVFSMFSAQIIFQVLIYQFFNTIFTIAGGWVYAALDEEWSMDQSLKYPYLLYTPGHQNRYFNYSTYLKTFFLGMFYGIITSLIVFTLLESGTIHNNGRVSYMVQGGMVIFFIIVFTVNIKILLMAHTYHLALILIVIVSILGYFLFYIGFIWVFKNSSAVFCFFTFWTTPNVWFVIVIVCFITLGLDFAWKKYADYYKDMLFNQEVQEGKQQMIVYN